MGVYMRFSFPGGLRTKIILPTVLVITMLTFPVVIAWHGIHKVQEKNKSMRDYSQALASLNRVSAELQEETKAEEAIVAGDLSALIKFSQANDIRGSEIQNVLDLAPNPPESGWANDLKNLTAWDRSLFENKLVPAAAAGNSSQVREASTQIQEIYYKMNNLISYLIQSFETRSNEASVSVNVIASESVRSTIASMAAVTLVSLALLLLLVRRVALPARTLASAVKELSRGNLQQRVKIKGNDEFAELGHAFNQMASSLQIRNDALLNEQSKLRSVHQSITDGIIVIGANGFLISANPAAEAILDRSESSLAGSHHTGIAELDSLLEKPVLVEQEEMVRCWEVQNCSHKECPSYLSPDPRCWLKSGTRCQGKIQTTFSEKRDACERCPVYRKNNCVSIDAEINNKSYSISVAPILNDEGHQEGRLAVLHDMTEERHRASQLKLLYEIANSIATGTDINKSLHECLKLCLRAMKASSGSIILVDEDGELKLAAHQGLSAETVASFRQHVGEGIAGWVAEKGEPLLLTGSDPKPGLPMVRDIKDAVCLPIRDKQQIVGVLSLNERRTKEGFTSDSLDFLSPVAVQIGMALSRARLYEKVASEKEKQAAIVECMGESLCVRGPDRTILFANSVHKEIFGEDCTGKKCYEVYLGRDRPCRGCPLDRCFTTGETVRRSHLVFDKRGNRRQLEATASPVREANGAISSCIEISRDVTEMLRIQDQAKSRLNSLTTLFEVSNALSSSLELSSIVDNLAGSTLSALKASAVAIMLFDDKSRRLVLNAVAGDTKGWTIKPGDVIDIPSYGINGLVSGVGPFCVTQTGQMSPASMSLAPPGSQSVLIGRLSSRGKLLGLISVSSTRKGAFSEPGQMELFVDITNHAAVAIENADMYKRLEETFWSTIRSLAEAIDAKDSYTRGHSDRVAEYAEALARRLKLKEDMLNAIRCAGYLHDTGKIGIPDAILLKPGKLNDEEYRQIMKHPILSHKIIEPVEFPYDVKPLVRHHHERMDGSGYPDGLTGNDIPLGARIIGIADAYEAMTSDRPYRKALTQSDAIAELKRCAGTQFDADLVQAFIEVLNN